MAYEEDLLKKAFHLLNEYEEVDEAIDILLLIKDKTSHHPIEDEVKIDTLLLLADCYRAKNNYKAAFLESSLLIKEFPNDERARLSIATAHFELGDYLKALSILGKIKDDDFLWLKAHILQALGDFILADEIFLTLSKRSFYHKPIRLSIEDFIDEVFLSFQTLPKFVFNEVLKYSVEIIDIVDLESIKNSDGKISPMDLVVLENKQIKLVKKNIENFAYKKSQIGKILESAFIHALISATSYY